MNARRVLSWLSIVLVLAAPAAAQQEHAGHGAKAVAPGATPGAPSAVPGMAEVDIPPGRRQLTGVRTAPVERSTLTQTIRTVGIVTADERLVQRVQTRVAGWVKDLRVNYVGASVRAGDPILSIYSPDLVSAEREYLLAQRSGSRELLDAAHTRLRLWGVTDTQIAELGRSQRPSEIIVLHSPIAGVVTLKPATAGMYVTPEMPLYTVTDLSTVWVWADIYENDASLVAPQQRATITLTAQPTMQRAAVVSFVSPTFETSTRTLRVRLSVHNPDGALKPGMYATVTLESPISDVLTIPGDAVIDTGERRVVFVQIGDGRYQPRAVTLGRRAEGRWEVLEGLADGERVVVSAQFLLDSESRLRAIGGTSTHGGH